MRTATSSEFAAGNIDYDRHMQQALLLAQNVLTATPNPRVGCVIVNDHNEVVGEGWHAMPGHSHAEVNALDMAGSKARGATAFVSLAPCSHHGKTPPCTDALIAAGIKTVVIASSDPFESEVDRGVHQLQQAGLDVIQLMDYEQQARQVNPGYMKRLESSLPYVRCKLAMSLDGRTAAANRESKWITGPESRADVQRLRVSSCAIITGVNTVLDDDPAMIARIEEMNLTETETRRNEYALSRQPLRVILDSSLRTPSTARILRQSGETKIVTLASPGEAANMPASTEIIQLAEQQLEASGRVDLRSVLELLASRFQVNDVLLEAGPELSGAMVRARLVDELIIYMAPSLLGNRGMPLLNLPWMESMSDHIALQLLDVTRIGNDCRVTVSFSSSGNRN